MQIHTRRHVLIGFGAIALVVALSTCAALYFSRNNNQNNVASQRSIKIGIQMSPAMAVVMVADDRGFFEKSGVHVEIVPFTAGKFALQAQLAGSIDYSVSGEVPTCLAVLQGNRINVVSQVVERTTNEVRVVAWRETEISEPEIYFKKAKRKLSTSLGGGPEMYTYTFLKDIRVTPDEVEIVSQKPEDMPASLESRSVDAIAVFDPFAFIAEKRLGEKAITFADRKLYSELYVLNASPDQLREYPKQLEQILNALIQAAEFIEAHPSDAKDIVARYTKLDLDVVNGIWGNFAFRPALTRELIDTWNDEVEWAKQTDKVPKSVARPDFRHDVISEAFLRHVSPTSVKID